MYNEICLVAAGHDPEGRWVEHLEAANPLLEELSSTRFVSLTEGTHFSTVDTALKVGWKVNVEPLAVGSARFAVIRRGLKTNCDFVNLWDGDRLLYAAIYGSEELRDIVERIPKYDFFMAGATREAIATHQSSMPSWEEVKSWALGSYLGIKGAIASRGCFGFSREYAEFLVQHENAEGDETDAIFVILSLAFKKLMSAGQLPSTGRETVGYSEYAKATSKILTEILRGGQNLS